MKMNFIQTPPNQDLPGDIRRADSLGQFHIDKSIVTPRRSGLVGKHVYLHHYSGALLMAVLSDWLSGSHTHFLNADWLAAESGLAASLPSFTTKMKP